MSPLAWVGLYFLGALAYMAWVGLVERNEKRDATVMAAVGFVALVGWPLLVLVDVILIAYRVGQAIGQRLTRKP